MHYTLDPLIKVAVLCRIQCNIYYMYVLKKIVDAFITFLQKVIFISKASNWLLQVTSLIGPVF